MHHMILFQLYSFPKEMGKAAWLYGQTISLSSPGKLVHQSVLAPDRLDLSLLLLQQNPAHTHTHTPHRRDVPFGTAEVTSQLEPKFFGSLKPAAEFITTTSRKVLSEGWYVHNWVPAALSPKCELQGAQQHQALPFKRETQGGTSNGHIEAPNTSTQKGFQQNLASLLLCLNAPLTEIPWNAFLWWHSRTKSEIPFYSILMHSIIVCTHKHARQTLSQCYPPKVLQPRGWSISWAQPDITHWH